VFKTKLKKLTTGRSQNIGHDALKTIYVDFEDGTSMEKGRRKMNKL